jgi:hypothetical protein
MVAYSKVLSRPEARHRYWHIHKDQRGFFPESGKVFKLKFGGKTFELKVNHKDDVMTGQLYEKHRFLEGDRITVTIEKNGSFVLEAPDTHLYPNL